MRRSFCKNRRRNSLLFAGGDGSSPAVSNSLRSNWVLAPPAMGVLTSFAAGREQGWTRRIRPSQGLYQEVDGAEEFWQGICEKARGGQAVVGWCRKGVMRFDEVIRVCGGRCRPRACGAGLAGAGARLRQP